MTAGETPRPALDPAVAGVRNAVRDAIRDAGLAPEPGRPATDLLVLTACSGGPDSLALALAAAFVLPRLGLRHEVVIVDHGLQAEAAAAAVRTVEFLRSRGIPAAIRRVEVTGRGDGLEAAARDARYRALTGALAETGAAAVLLGHTLDDQAETVLLGLARGSGARSLRGMRPARGPFLRPLLGVRRADTVAACAADGATPWHDPMNLDPRFARVRVRGEILPLLEAELGPGVAKALARTAGQLAEDADALDALAAELQAAATIGSAGAGAAPDDVGPTIPGAVARPDPDASPDPDARVAPYDRPAVVLDVAALVAAPPALRRRALRNAVLAAGAPGSALNYEHIRAVDALLPVPGMRRPPGGNPPSNGRASLPGGLRARRDGGRLLVERLPPGDGSRSATPPAATPPGDRRR